MSPTNTRQLPCSATKRHEKTTCSGKRESCHLLTSTLVQLSCTLQNIWQLTCSGKKKRELPSACNHTRAVAMYTAKRMTTDSLGVGEEAGVWARWQTLTHQPLCVTENWYVGELLNAHTPALRVVKQMCGRPLSHITHASCPTWHTKSANSCQDSCKSYWTVMEAYG